MSRLTLGGSTGKHPVPWSFPGFFLGFLSFFWVLKVFFGVSLLRLLSLFWVFVWQFSAFIPIEVIPGSGMSP